ncbi:hypothetical protein Csa_017022 [Cucumis sativus]|uniref:GB1/RHD3-type G domain-containing protein n=1 Tax=Cucumis sativus TaxID=3659 RepID=A0A0A0KC21_CUCSA|nr:hypothetical protein Csa_017022 [Cucumis sativus]
MLLKGGKLFSIANNNGIWLAKCTGIEPCTVVMDLEGNDGRERGEIVELFGDFASKV